MKGYFLDNVGLKTECLIKDMDWEISPKEILYKLDQNSKIATLTLENCSEFGMGNDIKYIRQTVDIDQSSNKLSSLSYERNPVYKSKLVFLRLLVGGSANLYLYAIVNRNAFFYNVGSNNIMPLMHKRFLMLSEKGNTPGVNNADSDTYNVHENNFFHSQLYKDVNCAKAEPKSFTSLKYDTRALMRYFKSHNICSGDPVTDDYSEAILNKKSPYNVKISGAVNQATFEVDRVDNNNDRLDFDKKTTFSIGVEFEYLLPFNKNKWGAFIEPNFSGYSGSAPFKYRKSSVDYVETLNTKSTFIEIPVGLRHYFFLTPNSKIFINASYNATFANTPNIELAETDFQLSGYRNFGKTFSFGAGYNYHKIYAEFRFYTAQDLDGYLNRKSNFSKAALILRYKILN